MKIMVIVFGGVLLLAIVFAILDWYYWGRSPKSRYQTKRVHLPSKFISEEKEGELTENKETKSQGTRISTRHTR